MPDKYKSQLKFISSFHIGMNIGNQYVGLMEMEYEGIKVYFIDSEFYFGGMTPYGDMGHDIPKFAFFCKAVLSALPVLEFRPDIIHCHDWQTGLIPVLLKDIFSRNEFYRGIKSIMTIHNLKFQGVWNIDTVRELTGLMPYHFTSDKLEAYGDANYLKGGLVYADKITTVSENYAKEIQESFYGERLDGVIRSRANDLVGIANGIDYDEYNPGTDKYLKYTFNQRTFRKEKVKNKMELQKELGLEVNPNKFMMGIVSRLTEQKGLDLVDYVIEELCREDTQFVIVGTGTEQYENLFRHFAWKYPERVSANIYYSNDMAHKVYASADAYLMPSRFEPCGLSQLMSLRYGTIPIVRETGGLKDTVQPFNEYESTGTGFTFANYNAHEMLDTINYARHTYYNNKREWNKMVDRAMLTDNSWRHSARRYVELYRAM
jgi:starch synthase